MNYLKLMSQFAFFATFLIFFSFIKNGFAVDCLEKLDQNLTAYHNCISLLCGDDEACLKNKVVSYTPPTASDSFKKFISNVPLAPAECNQNCSAGQDCLISTHEQFFGDNEKNIMNLLIDLSDQVAVKSDYDTCDHDWECESLKCQSEQSQSIPEMQDYKDERNYNGQQLKDLKVCAPRYFCRLGELGEKVAANVNCAQPLVKDASGICVEKQTTDGHFIELLKKLENQEVGSCLKTFDPDVQKYLNNFNSDIRAFEVMFMRATVISDRWAMFSQIKDKVVRPWTKKRSGLVVEFNENLNKVLEDFKLLSQAKAGSQKKIIFRGEELTEGELEGRRAAGHDMVKLMIDLELIRLVYEKSINASIQGLLVPFELLLDDYLNMSSNRCSFKFGDRSRGESFCFYKNKRKFRTKTEFNFGSNFLLQTSKVSPIINEVISRHNLSQSFNFSKINLFDTPVPKVTMPYPYVDFKGPKIGDQALLLESWSKALDSSDRSTYFHKIIGKPFKSNQIEIIKKWHMQWTNEYRNHYRDIFTSKENSFLYDPELNIYSGCLSGQTQGIPENGCRDIKLTLDQIGSHGLVHMLAYSANGDLKRYDNYFGGGKAIEDGKDIFRLNGPRGKYLAHLHKSFQRLILLNEKLMDHRQKNIDDLRKALEGVKTECFDQYVKTNGNTVGFGNGTDGIVKYDTPRIDQKSGTLHSLTSYQTNSELNFKLSKSIRQEANVTSKSSTSKTKNNKETEDKTKRPLTNNKETEDKTKTPLTSNDGSSPKANSSSAAPSTQTAALKDLSNKEVQVNTLEQVSDKGVGNTSETLSGQYNPNTVNQNSDQESFVDLSQESAELILNNGKQLKLSQAIDDTIFAKVSQAYVEKGYKRLLKKKGRVQQNSLDQKSKVKLNQTIQEKLNSF